MSYVMEYASPYAKQSACKLNLVCAHLTASQPRFSLFSQPPIHRAFLELGLGLGIMARHPLSYLTPRTSRHRSRVLPWNKVVPNLRYGDVGFHPHFSLLKPSVILPRHS